MEDTFDFDLDDEGSFFLLTPRTEEAQDWVEDCLSDDPNDVQYYGRSVVIEHRYVEDIVDAILLDGLTIEGV